jgi:hypothetical protein
MGEQAGELAIGEELGTFAEDVNIDRKRLLVDAGRKLGDKRQVVIRLRAAADESHVQAIGPWCEALGARQIASKDFRIGAVLHDIGMLDSQQVTGFVRQKLRDAHGRVDANRRSAQAIDRRFKLGRWAFARERVSLRNVDLPDDGTAVGEQPARAWKCKVRGRVRTGVEAAVHDVGVPHLADHGPGQLVMLLRAGILVRQQRVDFMAQFGPVLHLLVPVNAATRRGRIADRRVGVEDPHPSMIKEKPICFN